MKRSKTLIKESPWLSLWKLVNIVGLEEIAGGSVLGSPSCSIDGTGVRGLESHRQGRGKSQKPGGNVRLGWVRRLVPNFRWAISNKHVDHNEVGDNIEKISMKRIEIRRKTREQQMRHDRRFQTPEPDNHYDFCLIP
ncbi:protein BEX4 isoform X1 [Sturnira hondurensis]|uniref:protein BEX4 isoform X1 n=1 Tax=Sturnira hondurensis TaxID=192404 RepID=UPI001879C010|nr:protein BEX4 isoform X1 [Sturnira hondurensis]XP_036893290.1 protein BEX4 isoform X1 [Sturnira hondurensis]